MFKQDLFETVAVQYFVIPETTFVKIISNFDELTEILNENSLIKEKIIFISYSFKSTFCFKTLGIMQLALRVFDGKFFRDIIYILRINKLLFESGEKNTLKNDFYQTFFKINNDKILGKLNFFTFLFFN